MITLFDSAAIVKPARPFGQGILDTPAEFVPSEADLAWAAAAFADGSFADEAPELDPAADFDPADLEDRAVEAEHQDAFARYIIPPHVARLIDTTSIIGHDVRDLAADYRDALAEARALANRIDHD
jgi:hypothetical protein